MELKSRIETMFINYKNNNFFLSSLKNEDSGKFFVPENLTWIVNLSDARFQFIGSTPPFGTFGHLRNISFLDFIKLTKPCFLQNHINLIELIVNYFSTNDHNRSKNLRFQVLLPIRLSDKCYYHYVKQTITPRFIDSRLYALQFVNIPIKCYSTESYTIEVFNNEELDAALTAGIIKKMDIPQLFTEEQINAVKLIYKGLTSNEIAEIQFKTRAAVYKLNRKILERVSDYFDMSFNNVYDAVRFYSDCFRPEWEKMKQH